MCNEPLGINFRADFLLLISRAFDGSSPHRRVGSRGSQNLAGRVGLGHNILKSHGSGRVGSSRVKRFKKSRGAGRVGSIGSEILRVGSGRVGSGQ